MRIGWAMQISPGGQAGEKSGKDATPGHTVAAVYDRRTRLSKNLPPSTGKMPVGPTAKMGLSDLVIFTFEFPGCEKTFLRRKK